MKKFLALFLALVLVLGLVACGGKKTDTNKDGDGDVVNLTVGLAPSMYISSYTENTMTKWLEEECGVKLTFVEYAGGTDVATQISTTIAARLPLPDILIGIELDAVTRNRYGQEGYFYDMQDLFADKEGASKTFWTRLQELSEQDQENTILQMTNPETGAIYAVPTMETSLVDSMYYQTWINKEWLAKVGMSKPTNNDELLKVLRAFQKTDCNGNGQKDEIPLMASVNGNLSCFVIDWLLNTFTYYDRATGYIVEDGKLVKVATTDEYREGLKFIRQLYKEGLLSSLVFTSSGAELKSMFTPADGVAKGGIVLGHLTLHSSDSSPVLDQYEPLQTWGNAVRRATTCKLKNFISGDCENPEKAFEVMMKLWTKEGAIRNRYGNKGTDWTEADEGAVSLIGIPAEFKIIRYKDTAQHADNWGLVHCTLNTNAEYESAQVDEKDVTAGMIRRLRMHAESSRLYDEAAAKYNPKVTCMPLILTAAEQEETQMERINVPNRTSKYQTYFITGQEDINSDATWNKYLKTLKDDGLDKIVEQDQKIYERQLERLGK